MVGDIVFGVDDDTMESVVLDLLRARGWSLGLAESVTGGLVAGRLTGVPGASEVFRGCDRVSYASEVKFDLLGVQRRARGVSEAAALEMAAGARRVLECRRRAGAHRRRRADRAGRHAGRHAVRRTRLARG